MDISSTLLVGITTAFSFDNLIYCFVGVLLGTFVGVLPGIGALAAISLLLPLSYHLDPTGAIIMLAGVFYGANFGGSIASILMNLPGTPAHAVTCIDGYKMTLQGRGGPALIITAASSFVGGMIGVMILILFSPAVAQAAFAFGPAEFFSMMLLGLTAASMMSSSGVLRNLAMLLLGILLGLVGMDINSGIPRFTFGIAELTDGINLVALAMGLFGVAEMIDRLSHETKITVSSIKGRVWPSIQEWRDSVFPTLRGTAVGAFFGALPGTGPATASFISYALEKKIDHQESVGNGSIEGIAGPEAANNAAAQTEFVPTLSLGIPGDAITALLLAVLVIHGIQPGPLLMTQQPELFWGLIVSFVIGNFMLLILNIPLIKIWVGLLKTPYCVLYPTVLVMTAIGVYSVNNNVFDILLVILFGIMGFIMKRMQFDPAPLLLGFVLGPMVEENFRRALTITQGNFSIFLDRPISMIFLSLTVCILSWPLLKRLYQRIL